MRTVELLDFIQKRHNIYRARKDGRPKPWTDDPVLQNYRFCNVYRELDSTTQWIAKNWRDPNQDDPNLWFAMAVARYINSVETLAEIGYQRREWLPRVEKVLRARKARGDKLYSAAYMISTHSHKIEKVEYLCSRVLKVLWEDSKSLRPATQESIRAQHNRISSVYGVGSFMAAQIIADYKYARPYLDAPDWWTFAASGPGSRKGLNFIVGRDMKTPWKEEEWRDALSELQKLVDPEVEKMGFPRLHAQDLQNCLCELHKIQKLEQGLGRPKQKYNGV